MFNEVSYWTERYNQRPELFDWYVQINQYAESYIYPVLNPESKILIIGAGTSRECLELYDAGYTNIINADFCPEAKRVMEPELEKRPGIEYVITDLKTLDFPSEYFDVIIDKGTFDCVLTEPTDPAENLRSSMREVFRTLKTNGWIFSLSYDEDRMDVYEYSLMDRYEIELRPIPAPVIEIDNTSLKKHQSFYLYIIQKTDVV